MTHKKKHKTCGLTAYNRRKMNHEDVAKWVEDNKEALANQGLLTIQPDPNNPDREVWHLRFEK